MKYDCLILGAGLSGSTCAYLLARSGKRVLLVERLDAATKEKLCGGLLTPRAVTQLQSVFGMACLNPLSTFEHTSMRILFGEHDRTIPIPSVIGVHRAELDRFALSCALNAGADILDSARVDLAGLGERQVTVASKGLTLAVEYDVLIAADGAGSQVRRKASGLVGKGLLSASTQPYPSLEAYVPSVSGQLTGLYLADIDGYCWYAPCGEAANVGIAGSGVSSASQMRRYLDGFAADLGIDLSGVPIRGACIPNGSSPLLCCPELHAFFLGDAAGLASPITGEGIYFALRSAWALSESRCIPESYVRLMARDLRGLSKTLKLLPVVYNERNMDRVLAIANVTKLGSGKAARLALRMFADL